MVDPNLALEFKRGTKKDLDGILAYPVIYRDVRSTEAHESAVLQKNFGTTDVHRIAERIIKEGELQLTTEQRRQMVEQKRTQIANIISRKAVNPQTNAPHPPQRILNVMEQAGINVDPFIDAEQQVDKVLKAIKVSIPIKFQKILFQIKIPAQHSGRAYSILKASGEIKQEQWLNDGSLQVNIEVLAGVQDDLFQKLANLTHGEYESKIVKREDI